MTRYYGKNGRSKAERDLHAQISSERRDQLPVFDEDEIVGMIGADAEGEYDDPEELTDEQLEVLRDIEAHRPPLPNRSYWEKIEHIIRGD